MMIVAFVVAVAAFVVVVCWPLRNIYILPISRVQSSDDPVQGVACLPHPIMPVFPTASLPH